MNLYSAEEAEKLAKVFEYRGPELDNIRDLMYHLNEAEAAINCAPDYYNELLNTICRK